MILKPVDERQRDIKILNDLLLENINSSQKEKIELEIKKINAGLKAQKQFEYETKFYFQNSKNFMVLHDIRLEFNDRVAQIDTLLINRVNDIFVCETKGYQGGLFINENLEFSSSYQDKRYAIASPIEQNEKHIMVLRDLLLKNNLLGKRLGMVLKPTFYNMIILSNETILERSKKKLPENVFIVKNDQFVSFIDSLMPEDLSMFKKLSKIISQETVERLAKDILMFHQPIEYHWRERFGIVKNTPQLLLPIKEKKISIHTCEICEQELDASVLFWCRKNKVKYGGKLLCREHQKTHAVL